MESSAPECCPLCGSDDVKVTAPAYNLYLCLECDEHFTDADDDDTEGSWDSYGRHRERLREHEE